MCGPPIALGQHSPAPDQALRTRIFLTTTLALSLAGLTACGEEGADPSGLAESAEAEAVLRSASALPSLGALIDQVTPPDDRSRATLVRARELWDQGTAVDDPRGSARRRLAIGYALPVLEEALPPAEWSEVRDRIDAWLDTAEAMLRHLSLPAVEQRLDAAREHLYRADASTGERSRRHHLLLASSELVETTPRFVARAMSRDAQRVVEQAAIRAEEPVQPRVLERARRMKDWSARAVEEGEYLLAIQRAYYAMQLVERP